MNNNLGRLGQPVGNVLLLFDYGRDEDGTIPSKKKSNIKEEEEEKTIHQDDLSVAGFE